MSQVSESNIERDPRFAAALDAAAKDLAERGALTSANLAAEVRRIRDEIEVDDQRFRPDAFNPEILVPVPQAEQPQKHVAVFTHEGQTYYTDEYSTRQEAEAAKNEMKRQLALGEQGSDVEQSWAAAVDAWLNSEAGANWPGGPRNRELMGRWLISSGLDLDHTDKQVALTQCFAQLTANNLLYPASPEAEKAAAEKAAADKQVADKAAADAIERELAAATSPDQVRQIARRGQGRPERDNPRTLSDVWR